MQGRALTGLTAVSEHVEFNFDVAVGLAVFIGARSNRTPLLNEPLQSEPTETITLFAHDHLP